MDRSDVAFSLVSADVPIAEAIQSFFPGDLNSFLYTQRQQELILAQDGLEAVPFVFREARLCVVLHREGWGQTRWTRLEKQTIGDRFMDEGSRFLLLVRLDDSPVPAWLPSTDLWVHYDVEGPKGTAAYITSRLNDLQTDNAYVRATRRSVDRRPVPIARYQTQFQRIEEHYTTPRPRVCDACTAAVEFRPMVRVVLLATGTLPAVEEHLCPRCARERGVRMGNRDGLDDATMYDVRNPSFVSYLNRILRYPILPSLSKNNDLQSKGVTNVGSVLSSSYLTIHVSTDRGELPEITIPTHEIERKDIRSVDEVYDHLKSMIQTALAEREAGSES